MPRLRSWLTPRPLPSRIAAARPSISAFVRFSVTATVMQFANCRIPAAERQARVVARVAELRQQCLRIAGYLQRELLGERRLEPQSTRPAPCTTRSPRSAPSARTTRPSPSVLAARARRGERPRRARAAPGSCRCCSSPSRGLMCCSRVWSVNVQHRFPLRSVVWPTSRPGIFPQVDLVAAREDAEVRPAEAERHAKPLPLRDGDVRAVVAGPLQHARASPGRSSR